MGLRGGSYVANGKSVSSVLIRLLTSFEEILPMTIAEFAASVDRTQRELISSGFMKAVEEADATLRRLVESMGGAEGVQRIIDEQNRMLRQLTGQNAPCQQLHAITNLAPMEYPRIDPDILYRPRRSAARDRDFKPLPKRTILRREVKTKIGFIR
jgi:hypothetical protein